VDNDAPSLSTDSKHRKTLPMMTGVIDYFPAAIADIARLSRIGNDQHNAGQPMHWARGKSSDHADCVIRHLVDRGTIDTDGVRHSTKAAWRALALLQEELEAAGLAPLSRGSRAAEPQPAGPKLPPADEHFSRTKAALKQPMDWNVGLMDGV
jgi:hypothetical protein